MAEGFIGYRPGTGLGRGGGLRYHALSCSFLKDGIGSMSSYPKTLEISTSNRNADEEEEMIFFGSVAKDTKDTVEDLNKEFSSDFRKESIYHSQDCTDIKMTFHVLSQSTSDSTIKAWCSQTLVQIIQKRRLNGNFLLPSIRLTECTPAVLRRIVISIRDELKKDNSKMRLKSTVPHKYGVFHKRTKMWEIDAYDEVDARLILEKFLKISEQQLANTSVFNLTTSELKQVLKNAVKEMQDKKLKDLTVKMEMPHFDGDLSKKLDQIEFAQHGGDVHAPNDPIKFMIQFTSQTPMSSVSTWSLDIVVRFLQIWKAHGKLEFNVPDLKKLKSCDLRKMLWDIRSKMQDNDIPSLNIPVYFTATIHVYTEPWELDAYNMNERMLFVTEICSKLGIKNLLVENMTNKEITKKLHELVASTQFKKQWTCISMPLTLSSVITQKKLDGPITKVVKIVKDSIVFPPTLTKETNELQVYQWSPRILVEFLCIVDNVTTQERKYELMLTRSDRLRKMVLERLHKLKKDQSPMTYSASTNDTAYFSKETKDWEIQSYCYQDCLQIYRSYMDMSGIPSDADNIKGVTMDVMKHDLRLVRDAYLNQDNEAVIHLKFIPEQKEDLSNDEIDGLDQSSKNDDKQKEISSKTIPEKEKDHHIGNLIAKIRSMCTHDREDILCAMGYMYDDLQPGCLYENIDAVPVLEKDTTDMTIILWPERTKRSILQLAGMKMSDIDPSQFTHSVLQLRNNMKEGEKYSSNFSDNLRLYGNIPDSHLHSMTDHTLRQLYGFVMKGGGVQLSLSLVNAMSREDLLLELQYIRALQLLKQRYYLNLLLTTLETPEISNDKELMEKMTVRLKCWVDNREKQPPAQPQIDTSYDIEMIRGLIPDTTEYHIDEDTADISIITLAPQQSKNELRFQNDMLPDSEKYDIDKLSQSDVLLALITIRNRYLRIQQALDNDDVFSSDSSTESNDLSDEENAQEEINNRESDVAHDDVMHEQMTMDQEDNLTEEPEANKNLITPDKKQRASLQDIENAQNGCENDDDGDEEMDYSTFVQMDDTSNKKATQSQGNEKKVLFVKQSKCDEHRNNRLQLQTIANRNLHTIPEEAENRKVTSFEELGNNANNLYGYDVMQISTANTDAFIDGQLSGHQIKKLFFFLRVQLSVNAESTHIPSLVKKFIKVMREADPSFTILPFASVVSENLDQDQFVITEEDQLPDSVSEMEKWVVGVEIDNNFKLIFSMRVSNSLPFKDLRAVTRRWCNKFDCKFSYDHIETKQIFRAGWFRRIHPRYHDRDLLKRVLSEQHPELKGKINIYPRKLWLSMDEKDKKKTTFGLAIDGDENCRVQILQALYKIRWSETQYAGATFVPFKATKGCNIKHQHRFFDSHNEYLKNTYTKVIELASNIPLTHANGSSIAVSTWLQGFRHNQAPVFQKVEVFDTKCLRVIYNKTKEFVVQELLANFYVHMQTVFGNDVASKVLGEKKGYEEKRQQFLADTEYGKQCGDMINSEKVVDQGESYVQKARGSKPRKTPQIEKSQNNQLEEISSLTKRCVELEAQVKESRVIDADKLNDVIKTKVKEAVSEVKVELQSQRQKDRTEILDTLKESEKRIEKKIDDEKSLIKTSLEGMQNFIQESHRQTEKNTMQMLMNSQQQLIELFSNAKSVTPRVGDQVYIAHRGGAK